MMRAMTRDLRRASTTKATAMISIMARELLRKATTKALRTKGTAPINTPTKVQTTGAEDTRKYHPMGFWPWQVSLKSHHLQNLYSVFGG
jgi:hypothetical protein